MRIFIRDFSIGLSTSIILIFSSSAWADCYDPSLASSRYVVQGGEVYDKETKLTWARCSIGQHWEEGIGCEGAVERMTWDEAMQQGGGLWRVPSVKELETLASKVCNKLAINEVIFPNMEMDPWYFTFYWASDPKKINIRSNWLTYAVDFYFGQDHFCESCSTTKYAVRLVRGGQ